MKVSIRVYEYKGIKDLKLKNIGKINVLCGKNSSGKSSILEAINSEENRDIGFSTSPALLEELYKNVEKNSSGFQYPYRQTIMDLFKEYMDDYISKNDYIFYSDLQSISINVLQETEKRGGFSIGSRSDMYFEAFKSVLYKEIRKIKIYIIPAKRNLKAQDKIDLSMGISPEGDAVINKLFYLKCQDVKSNSFKLYKMIYDKFNDITSFNFNTIPDNSNKLQLWFRVNNMWIEGEKCGLGLREILVIITLVLTTDYTYYLIEEPENHLHPDFQKKLLFFLKSVEKKQFLLATHSSVFVDSENVDKVYYCWYDGKVNVSDATSQSQIISALGYSVYENITSDAVIFVEGPTDIPVIKKILSWVEGSENFNIKFWPLGGDIMATLDLSVFKNRKSVFAIVDSDPGSRSIRETFKKNCRSENIPCYTLKRYSIENYFNMPAILKVFPDLKKSGIDSIKEDESVDKKLFKGKKAKTIKGKNVEIIEQMSIGDFEGTDLLDAIKKIVKTLKDNYEAQTESESTI